MLNRSVSLLAVVVFLCSVAVLPSAAQAASYKTTRNRVQNSTHHKTLPHSQGARTKVIMSSYTDMHGRTHEGEPPRGSSVSSYTFTIHFENGSSRMTPKEIREMNSEAEELGRWAKTTSGGSEKPAVSQPAQAKLPGWNSSAPTHTMSDGLQYRDAKVGMGAVAKAGDQVTVNYTGYLMSGKKFDSSLDRGQPFGFTLGAGNVIKGWDEGVAGMKVGGKRTLIIPAELGYGAGGNATIPGGATLVFDVQLLSTGP